MQTSKWTLAILLATCCTFPVMGLDASTSGMKTISKEGTMAQVHTGKHSPQHQEKGQKGVRKFYGRIVKTKVIVGGPIRTIRWPRPVRKIERAPINIKEKTPEELQRAVAEAVRKHEQEKAAQAAQQQSADFCEKNCRALRDDEM